MTKHLLAGVVILAINIVAGSLLASAFLLYLMKYDPILAAVSLLLALPVLLLQPWFVLIFLFAPGGAFVAPVLTTLVTLPLYAYLDAMGILPRVRPYWTRINQRKWLVTTAAVVASVLALGFSRYIDLPALHHGVPPNPPLQETLQATKIVCDNGRYYSLGQFIDAEWLWQVGIAEGEFNSLMEKLGMRPISATQIGPTFQDMPPYWWHPIVSDQTRAFSTADFPLQGRGQDGWHALATWDPQDKTLHIWIKDNF